MTTRKQTGLKTLKQEEVDGRDYRDVEHAREAIGVFIEDVYAWSSGLTSKRFNGLTTCSYNPQSAQADVHIRPETALRGSADREAWVDWQNAKH
jgi:hypothetical protein